MSSIFAVQYLVSVLILQASAWLLYVCGILNAMFLLSLFASASRCRGLVCRV